MATPLESEITRFDIPVALTSSSNITIVPHPEMVFPSRENPSTVLLPVGVVNPAASASPPHAPIRLAPSTSNWNPAMGVEE